MHQSNYSISYKYVNILRSSFQKYIPWIENEKSHYCILH